MKYLLVLYHSDTDSFILVEESKWKKLLEVVEKFFTAYPADGPKVTIYGRYIFDGFNYWKESLKEVPISEEEAIAIERIFSKVRVCKPIEYNSFPIEFGDFPLPWKDQIAEVLFPNSIEDEERELDPL